MHTLKFYSVDKNENIVRSRKVCPECGAGFFMAKHWDRHYCGRCHLTLKLDAETIKVNLEAIKKQQALKAAAKTAEPEVKKADAGKGKKKGKK